MARKGFERQGPLPTIGHYRGHGVTRLLIYCNGKREGGWPCFRYGRPVAVSIDDFPGEARLVDIEQKFRCDLCGCRAADLRPDWGSRPSDKKGEPARGWIMPPGGRIGS